MPKLAKTKQQLWEDELRGTLRGQIERYGYSRDDLSGITGKSKGALANYLNDKFGLMTMSVLYDLTTACHCKTVIVPAGYEVLIWKKEDVA